MRNIMTKNKELCTSIASTGDHLVLVAILKISWKFCRYCLIKGSTDTLTEITSLGTYIYIYKQFSGHKPNLLTFTLAPTTHILDLLLLPTANCALT